MTSFTEADLRTALRAEADKAPWPPEQQWRVVRRRIVRRRRHLTATSLLAVPAVAILVVGLVLTHGGHGVSQQLLTRPASYQQACSLDPHACRPGTSGSIPATLFPPLHLPRVRAGESCPVTTGIDRNGPYVGGQQYGGAGPVWMVLGDSGDPGRGISVLGRPDVPRWLAAENVWLVAPGYRGPFTVRATRLDGPGTVGFGESPTSTAYVEPPAPDPNSSDGWRFPPGTIWVTNAGCYGFQIDGTSFSETIVIDMQPPTG